MAAARKLSVEIVGNAKGAQKAFGDLERSASKSGAKTTKALSGIESGLVGLGVGAAAIGSFKAFEESEKIARQTEAVIKSTGGEAQVTSKHVADLAGEMSALGGVDDELVQQGSNMLLTFTKVRNEVGKGNDIFDQATMAANNYAAATGSDVVAANKLLGVSLQDPLKGMTKLTKAGVSFTDQQKAQVRAMVASGDTLGAQKIILSEFEKQYGGSLEANATASGKAQVAMENMGESVGAVLAPAMEMAAGITAEAAEMFDKLPKPLQSAAVFAGLLGTAVVLLAPKIVAAKTALVGATAATKTYGTATVNTAKMATVASTNQAAAVQGLISQTQTLSLAQEGVLSSFGAISQMANEAANKDLNKGDAVVDDWIKQLKAGTVKREDVVNLLKTYDKDAENAFFEAVGKKSPYALRLFREALGSTYEASSPLGHAIETLGAKAEKTGKQNKEAGDKVAEAGRTSEEAAVSHKRNSDSLAKIAEEAQAATSAISEFYDEQTGAVSTQIDAERALDAVAQSFKDNGDSLNIDTEKGRQNREAIIAAKDAQLEYAMTLRDTSGTGAAIESMVQYSGKLAETLRASGLTEEQTAALIAEMGLTPTQIYTEFKSNSTEAEMAANSVRTSIENVPGWKNIYFNAMTEDALEQIRILGTVVDPLIGSVLSGTAGAAIQQSQAAHRPPGKAKGGTVRRGSLYEVNEEGRELFQPGVTGRIIPADLSRSLMGGMAGGGVTNYITIRIEANARPDRELVSAITAAVEKGTRTSGRSPFTTSLSRLSRG